jgi:clan AA aspartic protease
MITGSISRHRAYVNLIVRGPSGQEGEVEFLLDTDFSGAMTLPRAACLALGLPPDRLQPARLANGTRRVVEIFLASVLWDGSARTAEVLEKEGAPLLGMSLLDGHQVLLQVVDGGQITIETM